MVVSRKWCAVAVAASLVLVPPAVSTETATSTSATPTAKLKRELRKYKKRAALYRRQRDRYEVQRDDARRALRAATRDLTALTGERNAAIIRVGALESENAGLRGQLPEQVAAVARRDNIGELFDLVVNPALTSWACGGTRFFGETFYSVDFDRRTSDGDCY